MTWDIKWDWLKQQNETILSTSKSPFSWAIWWHHLDYICREPWAPNLHLWHPAGVLVQSTTNDPTRNENGSAISWKQRKIQLKVLAVTRVQLATVFFWKAGDVYKWTAQQAGYSRLDISCIYHYFGLPKFHRDSRGVYQVWFRPLAHFSVFRMSGGWTNDLVLFFP